MNDSPIHPGESICARCGTAAGEERCWCFDLPNVIPLAHIGGEGCLCPDCLRTAIETAHTQHTGG